LHPLKPQNIAFNVKAFSHCFFVELTWCLISVKFCEIIRQFALGRLHFFS
jgi:hypothetical protein